MLKSAPADEVIAAVRRAAVAPDAFMATGLAEALRRRSSSDKPKLTPRETEVLDRLVAGDSIAAVAKKLYMSESTVKTHVSKVYEKLGAHNRASAVMAALRLGLVKPAEGGPASLSRLRQRRTLSPSDPGVDQLLHARERVRRS